MKSLFLAIFCAVGVGLAVAFALNSPTPVETAWLRGVVNTVDALPSAISETADGFGGAPEEEAPHSENGEPLQPAAIKAAVAEQVSVMLSEQESPRGDVGLHPAITERIDDLESQLDQALESSKHNERLLRDAVSTLQNATILQQAAEVRQIAWAQNAAITPPPTASPSTAPAIVATTLTQPASVASAQSEPIPLPPDEARAEIHPGEGDLGLTITIQDSDIREVLDLLSAQGMNILTSPNVQGSVSASLHDVTVEEALDAILKAAGLTSRREGPFIYVGTPADFESMDHLADHVATRVYRPNYVTAAELQALITPLLSEGLGQISVSSPADTGIPADNAQAGGDSFGGNEVVLVRDYLTVLDQIDQIVLEVDKRPLQVSIEAVILTVELKNNNNRGVDFELLRNKENARLVSGTPLASLGAIDITEGGVKFGFLDTSVAVFIEALESVGDTNVVAAPRLMCLNKQRAEILIGAQLGYVSTTVTENAATQTVDFLEVGTQLRLRPFIGSDGVIRLEVHPELSTGSVDVSGGFTLPNKSVTQVTTNIACPSGQTIIIGGLIREDVGADITQIPILGSLPVVGPLFRKTIEKFTRTEIIILLTPRIVGDVVAGHEGALAAESFDNRHEVRKDKMSPIGRRYYGKQYLRQAQAAWNSGDARAALRYVNLSIHFNALDSDAVDLRGEIMAGSGLGDESIHTHLRQGLAPWAHPVRDHSKDGAPWDRPSAPVIVEDVEPGVIAVEDFSIEEPGPISTLEGIEVP